MILLNFTNLRCWYLLIASFTDMSTVSVRTRLFGECRCPLWDSCTRRHGGGIRNFLDISINCTRTTVSGFRSCKPSDTHFDLYHVQDRSTPPTCEKSEGGENIIKISYQHGATVWCHHLGSQYFEEGNGIQKDKRKNLKRRDPRYIIFPLHFLIHHSHLITCR